MVIVPSAQSDNVSDTHKFPLSNFIKCPHVLLLHQGLIETDHFHRKLALRAATPFCHWHGSN